METQAIEDLVGEAFWRRSGVGLLVKFAQPQVQVQIWDGVEMFLHEQMSQNIVGMLLPYEDG